MTLEPTRLPEIRPQKLRNCGNKNLIFQSDKSNSIARFKNVFLWASSFALGTVADTDTCDTEFLISAVWGRSTVQSNRKGGNTIAKYKKLCFKKKTDFQNVCSKNFAKFKHVLQWESSFAQAAVIITSTYDLKYCACEV